MRRCAMSIQVPLTHKPYATLPPLTCPALIGVLEPSTCRQKSRSRVAANLPWHATYCLALIEMPCGSGRDFLKLVQDRLPGYRGYVRSRPRPPKSTVSTNFCHSHMWQMWLCLLHSLLPTMYYVSSSPCIGCLTANCDAFFRKT